MTYTITHNTQFNSLEIFFEGKPAQEVREALKALKFRWHSVKKCWYGYTDEETARAAIDGQQIEAPAAEKPAKPEAVNKYGVKVGDIFEASWGYEQTNVDFFQVVALVGASSVRVRQVCPPCVDESAVGPMSADRTYRLTNELLPPRSYSVFIKDQENGDLKRLKSYAADGVSNPQFRLDTFASAYLCTGETVKCYESWYY